MVRIVVVMALLILTLNCKHSVEPPKEEPFCEITDSTSHDFSWRVDTIGLWPSVLRDVDAIDENNVWAVGVIQTPDSDLVRHAPHTRNNAVKWNGSEFEYYQLTVISGGGTPYIQDLHVALTFSTDDIWFFSSSSYVRWNGIRWESAYIHAQKGIRAGWGTSSDNFYLVGYMGAVTHYDGKGFTLMDCGTDKDLHDITGYIDPETGLTNLWVAGEEILLHYDGKKWETVWDRNNPLLPDRYHPGAVYATDYKHIVFAAWNPPFIDGFCINTKKYSEFKELFGIEMYAYSMEGLGKNDFFIVGSYNEVAHYNGNTIKSYPETNGGWNRSVSYIYNNVYIVGDVSGQQGIFIHGTKN